MTKSKNSEKNIYVKWQKEAAEADTEKLEAEAAKINSYPVELLHHAGRCRREIIFAELEKRK